MPSLVGSEMCIRDRCPFASRPCLTNVSIRAWPKTRVPQVMCARPVHRKIQPLLFFPSLLLSWRFFFSLPPSRNSDLGSHSRSFLPPHQLRFCVAFSSLEDSSPFFPRRLATSCAHRRQVLFGVDALLFFLQSNSKSRTPGSALLVAAFEGNHYTTGATGA